MRAIRYSRYSGEPFELSVDKLMEALSDHFLQSGYDEDYFYFSEWNPNALEALEDAIRRAIERGDPFEPDEVDRALQYWRSLSETQRQEVIRRLIQRLADERYVDFEAPRQAPPAIPSATQVTPPAKVEVRLTDKGLDFLGYKALKDLLGSLGRSSFGTHDTRDLATGVEASGPSRPYEFGDTLNLDVAATIWAAIRRAGLRLPIDLDYADLHVHQCEHQSSCATVLMLDCSHSMILYGEDRFTPAKKVALALAHLIRTQYPGDSLRCVLFHDSAEEVSLARLARVQVGPYHTNTRDGLILAQRLLRQERKEMKQIIMITDGKPTAITLPNGRVYRNSLGLDPLVVNATLEEVSRCRRQGILINTFMLARDYHLVAFVKKVAELSRGKAYFTTPFTLGRYLLMDYLNRKTRVVH